MEEPHRSYVRQREIGRRRDDFGVRDRLLKHEQLLKVGRIIVSEMNMDFLFQVVMDQTNRVMSSERSTVFLYDDTCDELWSLVATGMKKNEIRIPADHGVAGWVFQNRKPLTINNAYNDERFYADIDKYSGFETRNILCVPLTKREGTCIGVLQSLNKSGGDFYDDDLELLTSMSHYVSVAVENARLYEDVKEYSAKIERILIRIETLERVKSHLTKFVPSSVAKMAEQSPDKLQFDKMPMAASILFIDIQGFSGITENYDQKLVNDMLEAHFSRYLECIYRHDGEVNETSGDGLMAIFKNGKSRLHARRAVSAALEIVLENDRLNDEIPYPWGRVELHLGVNSGKAWIGSTKMKSLAGDRWTYTASGLVTVLAARIGSLSSDTQLFVGPETHREVEGYCEWEFMGSHEVKNIKEPIPVYWIKDVKQ
ncbi:MAG: GAF domain-containing protein [Deltaproteobacteria bacterium]|nr:GAF domain-containing protein [Deltaproteobacteria bacterium]